MIFPKGAPPVKAFTAEEIYLRDEVYRAQVEHVARAGGNCRLKKSDGSWFTVVKDGVICTSKEVFNVKGK